MKIAVEGRALLLLEISYSKTTLKKLKCNVYVTEYLHIKLASRILEGLRSSKKTKTHVLVFEGVYCTVKSADGTHLTKFKAAIPISGW